MYDLIIRYLTSLYRPLDTSVVHDLNDKKVYGDNLREDIIDMFQVSDIVATACIEIWVHDEHSNFDTKKFWEDSNTYEWSLLGFPIASQVAARTVGLDLVAVQPLELPSSTLAYIDFQHQTQSAMTQQMGIPAERLGQVHHEVREVNMSALMQTPIIRDPNQLAWMERYMSHHYLRE